MQRRGLQPLIAIRDRDRRPVRALRVDLPVSWTNYIGVGDLYGVFNHTAGGYVLYRSPEYHRITRFRPNGVPMDGPGHYIYIRDNDTGDYWTVSWQPVGKDKKFYSCRHGLSYVKYLCDYSEIHAEQKLFVAMDEPVELWAVLSGAASRERGLAAMDAVDDYLYTPWGLMLNAPCFTKPDDAIGFVTRVYPGLKENGSVFSHPNPWAWGAEAKLGRGDRAMKFYNALCPALQNDKIETRKAEPYTYCQFISGRDHTTYGEAHHPFMTGSSGWVYYAATQYLLGVQPDFDCLRVDPCIPADWKEFTVVRRWRGAEYHIHVTNPDGVQKGVREILISGKPVDALPVLPAGSVCHAEVIMGGANR